MTRQQDKTALPLNLLIFDMDGVLIDVSRSYRATIRKTVQIYLETCLGFRGRGTLVTEEDVSLFKSIGGFNNDWDLTSGLLLYLLSISGLPPSPRRKRLSTPGEVLSYLGRKSSGFPKDSLLLVKGKGLRFFVGRVKSAGRGLSGVRRVLEGAWEGWVYRSGDLDHGNIVKRIFQEIYLGNRFTAHYRLQPLFYHGRGYYLRERPLIPRRTLASLRKKARLAIASGRPRMEALLALERFRLFHYFDSIVTLDECESEEARLLRETGRRVKRSKPHPYSIVRAVQETGMSKLRCAYIGDGVDDMLAVQAVKGSLPILGVGFLGSKGKGKSVKESLLKAGADLILERPGDLSRLVSPSPGGCSGRSREKSNPGSPTRLTKPFFPGISCLDS